MRRAGYIVLAIVGGLFALLAIAWIGVFYTPPGKRMIERIAEREAGAALNSEMEIGSLKGALPGHILLEDVTLSDEEGPWLTADRLELKWRPFALIRKRIVADDLVLKDVDFLRDPPPGDKPDDEARQVRTVNLPRIEVRNIVIDDFTASLGGETRRIDATGAVRLDGPEIALKLDVNSADGADRADIVLDKSPAKGRFELDAQIDGAPGGALTAIMGLEGPLRIAATGDGPVSAAEMKLDGSIGYYGDVTAEIVANLANFDGAGLNINLVPGGRLNSITELSAPVTLDARYDVRRRGGQLSIRKLTSAVGEIEGAVSWRAPRGFIARLNADLKAQLAEGYRSEIQEIAGSDLTVRARLDWRRDDYGLEATIAGPLATLTLENGATDLRSLVSGDATLTAQPREEEDAPFWIANGLTLEGALDADFENRIALDRARVETGGGARFAGAAGYGLTDGDVMLKGDFVLPSALIETLSPGTVFSGDVRGDIDLSGPLDRFTVKTAFETPALNVNDGALPPMNVEAALSGLPSLPNGEITARAANDAPRRLDVSIRSSEDGTIRMPTLAYAGRGFSLDGSGRVEANRQTLHLDLQYEGDENARPWPGVPVSGDATIKGVLSREGALSRMEATAGSLTVNDISVQGLDLSVEGPPGAMEISVESDRIETPQTGEIRELTAVGQLDARSAPKLTLRQFEAIIRDTEARLTQPARFSFENGVAANGLRLAWGSGGVIAIDGAFNDTRWRADAELTDVVIPGADGEVTASIDLDTDADTPGRGEFNLRSLLLTEEEASISGRFVWNGETLRLTDRGDEASLDMDVRLPLALTRSPSLGVDTTGEMSGRVRYNDDIQALAAYMPPVLQSIEGNLAADVSLSGTFAEPSVSGEARLTEGAYTEIETGFSLAGLHAEATASYSGGASSVSIKGGARGADQSRDNAITFNGDLKLGEDSNLDLTVNLDRAELSAHPVTQVRADGQVTLAGPLDDLKAEGTITIIELNAEIATPETTGLVGIDVIAYNDGEGTPPETEDPAREPSLNYDIRVEADDRIFVRGRGLESEWAADIHTVTGREGPLVLGSLNLRRGWLDFSGRRFELTRGEVDFDRNEANNPRLDIRAELETADVTAAIVVSGRANDPSIELTSTPSMPSEDVMALILFGKPAQELSAAESLQAAQALASLGGIGPFGGSGGGVTGKLRQAIGLDLLNFDVDPESGGGSLTVGKYVADGFFVSATQDAQGRNGSVSVKYEVTDNIVVETELEQDGDQTVSANWKKDF
jgi:translocation and assembly module TamB